MDSLKLQASIETANQCYWTWTRAVGLTGNWNNDLSGQHIGSDVYLTRIWHHQLGKTCWKLVLTSSPKLELRCTSVHPIQYVTMCFTIPSNIIRWKTRESLMTSIRQDGERWDVPGTWKLDHNGKFSVVFHKLIVPHKSFPCQLHQAVQERMRYSIIVFKNWL
jgi:hypothetical protein